MENKKLEDEVINDFGNEWTLYDQDIIKINEKKEIFDDYFYKFPFKLINKDSVGCDIGCGTGRWAFFFAPKVKKIYCIEPSNAINVAKSNLSKFNNVVYLKEKISELSLKKNSMDFGYSLGVLHHINDTENALKIIVSKLKKNAPFLLYLYYNFENKPFHFKLIFYFVNKLRLLISKFPFKYKKLICNIIAIFIYFPLSRISKLLKIIKIPTSFIPLNYYSDKSLYIMRNDSLDRFGTKLEKRYSKNDIKKLMEDAGLQNITFNSGSPFWVSLGYKK